MADLDHPGIARYHRAWIEFPPDGWQETKDRELLKDYEGSSGDEGPDGSASWNHISANNSVAKEATTRQSDEISKPVRRHPPLLKMLST